MLWFTLHSDHKLDPSGWNLKQENVLQPVMGIQPWHQATAILGKTSENRCIMVSSSQQQLPHSANKALMGHANWHGYRESVSSTEPCPAIQNQHSSPDHSRTDQPGQYLGLCRALRGTHSYTMPSVCSVPEQAGGLCTFGRRNMDVVTSTILPHLPPVVIIIIILILHRYILCNSCSCPS